MFLYQNIARNYAHVIHQLIAINLTVEHKPTKNAFVFKIHTDNTGQSRKRVHMVAGMCTPISRTTLLKLSRKTRTCCPVHLNRHFSFSRNLNNH